MVKTLLPVSTGQRGSCVAVSPGNSDQTNLM
jgi:hypothetical protein